MIRVHFLIFVKFLVICVNEDFSSFVYLIIQNAIHVPFYFITFLINFKAIIVSFIDKAENELIKSRWPLIPLIMQKPKHKLPDLFFCKGYILRRDQLLSCLNLFLLIEFYPRCLILIIHRLG